MAKPSDSVWTLEGGSLCIQLAKAEEAATWASALAGHALGALEQQADQKRLLLERFQAEVGAGSFFLVPSEQTVWYALSVVLLLLLLGAAQCGCCCCWGTLRVEACAAAFCVGGSS